MIGTNNAYLLGNKTVSPNFNCSSGGSYIVLLSDVCIFSDDQLTIFLFIFVRDKDNGIRANVNILSNLKIIDVIIRYSDTIIDIAAVFFFKVLDFSVVCNYIIESRFQIIVFF